MKQLLLTPICLLLFNCMMKAEDIPRAEYPRPQFVREAWINLNGIWTCEIDNGKSGIQRDFPNSKGFSQEVLVPFCIESKLSGIEHKDFVEQIWYQRQLTIPSKWVDKLIILHFGGVDYETELFLNGESIGKHYGGTGSFSFDMTVHVNAGQTCNLVLKVNDLTRAGGLQPLGKQCYDFHSRGSRYSRVTGIWQTVWMEAVSPTGLKDVIIVPDLDNKRFLFTPQFHGIEKGLKLRTSLYDGTKSIAATVVEAVQGIPYFIELEKVNLWEPGNPFLYDLKFEVRVPSEKGHFTD